MNTHQGVRAGIVVCTAIVVLAGSVGGMEIKEFDKMSPEDRRFYNECLTLGILKFLLRTSRDEEYDKMFSLFKVSDGFRELRDLLNELRELEQQGRTKTTPHVEHAMAITLKRHGIVIDMKKMMQFTRDFRVVKEPINCID